MIREAGVLAAAKPLKPRIAALAMNRISFMEAPGRKVGCCDRCRCSLKRSAGAEPVRTVNFRLTRVVFRRSGVSSVHQPA
jgi:hypothetical protein